MTGAKRKKSRKSAKKESSADVDQLRPGMPAKDSVVKVVDFISPQGTRYEIRKTTEKDPYDPPFSPQKKGDRKSNSSEDSGSTCDGESHGHKEKK